MSNQGQYSQELYWLVKVSRRAGCPYHDAVPRSSFEQSQDTVFAVLFHIFVNALLTSRIPFRG